MIHSPSSIAIWSKKLPQLPRSLLITFTTTFPSTCQTLSKSLPFRNGRLKEEHLFIAKANENASHLLKKSSKPLRPRIREIHDHDDDSDDDDKKKRSIKKVIRNNRNTDDFAPYSRSSQILARRRKKKEQWEEKEREERDKIKDFWLSLTDQERRELVKLEKEAVLKKMKEQVFLQKNNS